jgi:hypothetical protein
MLGCYVQVHLAGVGDFQLSQIDIIDDPWPLRQRQRQQVKGDGMLVEEESASHKVRIRTRETQILD